MPARSIVVAVDFSETSRDALQFACDVARHQSAQLHILHVVQDARFQAWSVEAAGVNLPQLTHDAVANAERQMAELPLPGLKPEQIVRAVIVGTPDLDIRRYAEEHQAEMIVLGTHGYGAIRRFLLGSVATRVVRDAPCPVVTVPHRTLRRSPAAPAVA